MKSFTYTFLALATIAVFFNSPQSLSSQTQLFDPIGTGLVNQQISATVSPENPTPGQDVTISLTAYGTNLNNANISWSVNDTQIQRGTGVTQFTLKAGRNGESKRVVATITPQSGPVITRTFTIAPQDVSIIYEADGYTPPFYKGKSTYAKEGTLTLVAMPNLISNGARLNPTTLTYKWIVDGTVQGSKSGYGKNTFSYTGSILGGETIVQVEVSTTNGTTKGNGTIILAPIDPEILVYERNPLYGTLFNKELTTNTLFITESEATVAALPFSMSATSATSPSLSYEWTINGGTIPVPKTQNFATFRNSTGQTGSSVIGITVNSTTHLLQMVRDTLTINF